MLNPDSLDRPPSAPAAAPPVLSDAESPDPATLPDITRTRAAFQLACVILGYIGV